MALRGRVLAGLAVVVAVAVVLAGATLVLLRLAHPRRDLAAAPNPDGTQTVVVGSERLLGLLGVEITHETRDAGGRVLHATAVKDSCASWAEAVRKYAAPPRTEGPPDPRPPDGRADD
jgi:hypothetical protein